MMTPLLRSRLAGRHLGNFSKLSMLPPAAKLHQQSTHLVESIHHHQNTRVSERQPLNSSAPENNDDGEDRATDLQHITGAQLYRLCRRGRLPANVKGDVARFRIDPSAFCAAHSRLQWLFNSSDRKMPVRLSYDPHFSTAQICLYPTPLHDTLASKVLHAFDIQSRINPDTDGFLDLMTKSEQELNYRGKKIIRTADLLVEYMAPLARKENPKHVAVLEVGLTQSYNSLRRLVDIWFEARPALNMYLLIKLHEKPRYIRHVNVQYVKERGAENFPARNEIDVRDVQDSASDGSLSMYGMPFLGKITGFMEIWVRDTKTGKPTMEGTRIDFYGAKSTPPNTVIDLCRFVPLVAPTSKVVLRWDYIRAMIDKSRYDTARKRCREVLQMVQEDRKAPRGRR